MRNPRVAYTRRVESVERETFVPASPEDAWDSVADLGGWLGAPVRGDVVPGEVIRLEPPDGVPRRAVVERVEPPRRLVFRWLDDPSRVDISLEPIPDGTLVRVVEQRIEPAVDPERKMGFEALVRR